MTEIRVNELAEVEEKKDLREVVEMLIELGMQSRRIF